MTRVPLSTAEWAAHAETVLPAPVWDFVEGGSGAEHTLTANPAAFRAIGIVPRVLSAVSAPATNTVLFGDELSFPLAVAPMAYQRLLHDAGERATARAAKSAGVPVTVSTFSSVAVEEVAGTGAITWFQLYWFVDRGVTLDLVSRAEAAGCRALVLTVDLPRMGRRLRDVRNGFLIPDHIAAANLVGMPRSGLLAQHTDLVVDPSLSWDNVAWLRSRTELPLVLKGILHPEDAMTAAGLGADAVVVSNHGGRQLDGAVATAVALPRVCAAVAGRCEVLVDSGIRSGTDVLKALALGANAVLLGRPVLWGLAAEGESGVVGVLNILHDELIDAMALSGCADLAAVQALELRRDEESAR